MSTLSSNFATLICGNSLQASSREYFLARSTFAAAFRYFFPSAIFSSFAAREGLPPVAQKGEPHPVIDCLGLVSRRRRCRATSPYRRPFASQLPGRWCSGLEV